jgi:hypothetical protein
VVGRLIKANGKRSQMPPKCAPGIIRPAPSAKVILGDPNIDHHGPAVLNVHNSCREATEVISTSNQSHGIQMEYFMWRCERNSLKKFYY